MPQYSYQTNDRYRTDQFLNLNGLKHTDVTFHVVAQPNGHFTFFIWVDLPGLPKFPEEDPKYGKDCRVPFKP